MSSTPSLYHYLDLPSSASQQAIEEAYGHAVLRWAANPNGPKRPKDVYQAYNVLSNPMLRAGYDLYGLAAILEHEDQYTEETPPSSAQTTPVAPSSQPITLVFHQPVPKPVKRVQVVETEEQEMERRRREIRRMGEPKEDRRRHTGSSSTSSSHSRDKKTGESRDKSSKSSSKPISKPISSSTSKSDSKERYGDKAGGSSSRSREQQSDRDKRSKDATRSGSSKDRSHRKIKPSFQHPIIFK